MKQHPTKRKLSATEQLLEQRLQAMVKPEHAVEWRELSVKLGPAQQTAHKPRRLFWLTPAVAVAAAVAWLVVIQPQTTQQPQPNTSPMLLAGNYSLDTLDQQLQRAYLEGADASEIDALWQRRAVLTATSTAKETSS
ncbi:hypothetical protein [Pseudidiomarina homiensis]|uniref:hypothetical protein n=1 Tax=Pseudidiomarina homiensis TaxID=364198 RepID=UPI00215A1062|nr:hypothetical protein [Pseudidiomarina homiensis]